MAGMYGMKDLLCLLRREGAEELRLAAGSPVVIVTGGKPRPVDIPGLTLDELDILLGSISTEGQREELRKCGDTRFIYVQNSTRFAVTARHSSGRLSVIIRNLDG